MIIKNLPNGSKITYSSQKQEEKVILSNKCLPSGFSPSSVGSLSGSNVGVARSVLNTYISRFLVHFDRWNKKVEQQEYHNRSELNVYIYNIN